MVEITSKAKKDLKELDIETIERIIDKIEEKLENNRDKDNISYIDKPQFGIEFQRLKITEGSLDHRIYFDFINSKVTVFAVRHRDFAYSQEDLEEVEKRLRTMNTD